MKIINTYNDFLKRGFTISIIVILISNLLLYYCMSKGFYSIETHLMIFIPGITFMSVFLFFTRGISNKLELIKLFVFCYVIYILLDFMVFWADNSLSNYFASLLFRIAIKEGDNVELVAAYSNLPFSIQSILVTLIIFTVTAIILFVVKKLKKINQL